jgi:glutamate--cysteine ligase catalytic subunit
MTILEILMGKSDSPSQSDAPQYPGLIPLVYAYLEYIGADPATVARVESYLEFLRKRASGEVQTAAAWMRAFVRKHPSYSQDSVINDEIAYDLMIACRSVAQCLCTLICHAQYLQLQFMNSMYQ